MIYASRFLRLMSPNLKGPDVLHLQELLQACSYYSGRLDGEFGPETYQALTVFQKAQNFAADGIAGPQTWMALQGVLAPAGPDSILESPSSFITIDIDARRLYFTNPQLKKDYPVAVGKPQTPSPLGNWIIVQKATNPGGPFGTRWMRLSVPWGGYGIHGTNNPSSIGKAVSHGCIRMYNQDVEEIYPLTPLGTPVVIVGKTVNGRVLLHRNKGQDVQKIQVILKKLGYYQGRNDGYFGNRTLQSVIRFQSVQRLKADGIVGPQTWTALVKALDLAGENRTP